MLQQFEVVVYFDAHIKWNRTDISHVLNKMSCADTAECDYYQSVMLGRASHSIYSATEPGCFDYLPMNRTASIYAEMGSANFMAAYFTKVLERICTNGSTPAGSRISFEKSPSSVQPISSFSSVEPSYPFVNQAPVPAATWTLPKTPTDTKNVTILIWTKVYGGQNLVEHIQHVSPVPDLCHVTFDQTLQLNSSKAVVFSMLRNDYLDVRLPPRKPEQLWIYMVVESPANVYLAGNIIDGLFNRTMTYRLDSDYPSPYGQVIKLERPLASNPYFDALEFPRNKTKLIAWMVSHCQTKSNRENVVQKLIAAGLQVDIYGNCGPNPCDRKDDLGCCQHLGRTYKFYLAFENSLCKDYITEKFIKALYFDMVPIVYGSGNYTTILPKYPTAGYIDVRDFESAKELAQYLLYLDRNETAYSEYFEWKRFYTVKITQEYGGFSKLCYDLQRYSDDEMPRKEYSQMFDWWVRGGKCGQDFIKW